VFAAGADLEMIRTLSPARAYSYAAAGQRALAALLALPAWVMAEIDGACYGGGLDLALACHIRIATERATFCHPGPRRGIVTGWGGTVRAREVLGTAGARRLFARGDVWSAAEAAKRGLVDEMVPAARWDLRRAELARILADQPRPCVSRWR
jgi:enoyl-CoA hydratase/carnithine racemase